MLPYSWALGQPDGFARRIARNTQVVLQEESALGRVTDPAGGSWHLDSLTDALARKAWELFQEIEARGGMVAALGEGEWNCPTLVLAEDVDPGPHAEVKTAGRYRIIDNARDIAKYFAHKFGTPFPRGS